MLVRRRPLAWAAALAVAMWLPGGCEDDHADSPWGDFPVARPGDCLTDFRLRAPTIVDCASARAKFRVADAWRLTDPSASRPCPASADASIEVHDGDPHKDEPDLFVCYQFLYPDPTPTP